MLATAFVAQGLAVVHWTADHLVLATSLAVALYGPLLLGAPLAGLLLVGLMTVGIVDKADRPAPAADECGLIRAPWRDMRNG